MKIQMYLCGCSGIINPVDANGVPIKAGDKLTWDFHDSKKMASWMIEPIFIVENHPSGNGLCAKGINKDLYLHDFRFKYCEIINDKTTP